MSNDPRDDRKQPESGEAAAKPVRRRSIAGRIVRGIAWTAGSLVLLLILIAVGLAYYSTTADFQQRMGKELASVLEDATGGKVDVGHVTLNVWHLAVEVDGLVIHGLEGPGEAPYLAADKIFVRIQLVNLLGHWTGADAPSHIGLNFLRVEAPHVHLIIDKDGKTNQPTPAHPSQSNEPVIDTLLDLKAKEVELVHGVAQVNDRAIPFNLVAQDLNAQVQYLAKVDHYGAVIEMRDLQTQIDKQPEAKSSLHVEAEVGRDMAELKAFDFHTGEHSELQAAGAINHFNNPEWQAQVKGSLEMKQITLLGNVPGLEAGSVELNIAGHNCYVAPAVAQQKPKFLDRLRSRKEAQAAAAKTLPPDPDCKAGYLLVGSAKLHGAAYRNEYVRLHDINGGAQLKITPTELLFTALSGYLPGGGDAIGELKIDNWLGEVPANTPPSSPTVKGATTTANKTSTAITGKPAVAAAPTVAPVSMAHAYLTVKVDAIPLRTILDITAPKYGDLGFDTAITGPVKVEWGGPVVDVSDSVLVDADLVLAPTGVHRKNVYDNTPITGELVGHYDGKTETVNIPKLAINTLQSTLTANGVLGVNNGDTLTALNVDLQVRDFSEYDQLLRTLELSANGRKGAAAIPVDLHGSAQFHGTARGEIAKLDVKGHLEANNLEVRVGDFSTTPATPATPPVHLVAGVVNAASGGTPTQPAAPAAKPASTDVHIDNLVADAEYTPAGLAVASSTITQGSAVLHVAGAFKPRTVYAHRKPTYVWDNGTAVDAKVQLANANVVDLLTIAGQQNSVQLTGTIAVNAHAVGTFGNVNGSGTVGLSNGVAYGEPYESVNVTASVQGQDIEATTVSLKLHGMTIAGNGGYDLTSKRLHGHIEGDNLRLSKFTTVQKANINADGVLSIVADANGTITQPGLKANIKLASVVADGKPIGDATLEAHSDGSLVSYSLRSTLIGTPVSADGQTDLTGDYQTKAKLTIASLDVARPLGLFQPGGVTASSNISGVITVSGPAKRPMALGGQALFSNFEITSQGLTFKAAEPLTIGLRDGLATLDQVHITGPDTDLHAGGTAQVFGAINAKTRQPDTGAGKLNINANGSVSMALAHTFDPDLITSGKVAFAVGAGGIISDPALTGKVQFENVNVAMEGIPNGLSAMNGTLVFNEDRLNVQSLVATTGGGQLKIGGFITYHAGLYADLTATGDVVRVRLYGLSATSNTSLRLQGGPTSLRLSGNVLLTRFGIGPDVDFAAFASAGGVQAPPDPTAASNKILLDVHVTSSPSLDFQNSYAKLAGTVDLTVRGTVAEPVVLGKIQITDGSATFAGTKYQLQRGDIYFTNPVRIDPTIDLDATARVETYDVTIGLHGTTENLKPTYRSEPPLSEADIFQLQALGRTQEEAQIYQEQQTAAGTDPTTSALLGGALNATVSNRVSKLFGGGSVKIDPSYVGTLGNSSARITVSQQLSRQLSVTYATNVNSSAEQLIQVQYDLTPNVSIVAARDETGVFSLVYKIRHAYR
jgi:translocation and assembly module TamB